MPSAAPPVSAPQAELLAHLGERFNFILRMEGLPFFPNELMNMENSDIVKIRNIGPVFKK